MLLSPLFLPEHKKELKTLTWRYLLGVYFHASAFILIILRFSSSKYLKKTPFV